MARERTQDDDVETPPADVPSPDATGAGVDPPTEPDVDPAAEAAPDREAAHAYHQRARLAEDRLAEVLTAYRTIKKENEGFRERISRNLERRFTQRHETLLLKFIDILDNLDRALEAAQLSYAGEPLLEGMILVRTQLLQRLQDEGLERIPVLGTVFDPAVSESVGTQPVADPDHHNFVVKELMRGYRVNGRVVRASRVVIGVYQEGAAVDSEPGAVVDNAPPPAEEPSIEEIVARAEASAAAAAESNEPEPAAADAPDREEP